MSMNSELKAILRTRHYLLIDEQDTATVNSKYLNAYLLANFGIIVDKPSFLTKAHVEDISREFHLNVPKSFYSNPQDTQYFTCDELLIEQIVSYFAYGSDLGRIEIFKKDLPEYVVGDELKLRTFYLVTEEEAAKVLSNIMDDFCAYTRPFSTDEVNEFITLYRNNYYSDRLIKCKENVFTLLPYDVFFARFLDKKDIVKLSIQYFGENANFKNPAFKTVYHKPITELTRYIPYVQHCPMSKKQAKYFNKVVRVCGLSMPKVTNEQSPDRRAQKFLREGNVVEAADIYAQSGSMLGRRVRMLLARANPIEAVEILNMLPAANPIVLYQLMSNLTKDDETARTFTFFHNNKVKSHIETPYEARYRKSKLNASTRKLLADTCMAKVREYYSSLPSLGKVYINPMFYNIGLPTNTSASGKGIDVLPTGSRMPCIGNSIRTFVHWKNAFDIDSSLIVMNADGSLSTFGWFNYHRKNYGNDILFSGDITGNNGAEYFDINLDALAAKGCKYVVQTFHGFRDKLNSGEIYAGYQNKTNLKTKAWDPKNIEMQFKVYGDSRGCVAFAIDVQTREVIILNQILESDEQVVNPNGFKTIEKYLQSSYLDLNIGMVAECRGEVVQDPADADVVFDDTYVQDFIDGDNILRQDIIRSYELEKLVALINK